MNIIHVISRTEKVKNKNFLAPYRYKAFQDALSKNHNFSFVPYDEFIKGLTTNQAVQHYAFNGNQFYASKLKPLDADVAQIEYYDSPSSEQKSIDMSYVVPKLADEKLISLINNSDSLKSQDKKFLYDVQDHLEIKPPKTYHFTNVQEATELLKNDGKYVIKPRFGSEGKGVEQLKISSLENLDKIENYIIQEEQENILGELRLVFGMGEFLGSRFMYNRMKPWEHQHNKDIKKYENIPILAGAEVIKQANKVYELSNCEFASVDFYVIHKDLVKANMVSVSDLEQEVSRINNLRLVEVNGFGTGFGNPRSGNQFKLPDNTIGDLNYKVAELIDSYAKQL